mmetsp:Transcript_73869/g.161640  ORF Transcript_73869/g.161640 Transcript_73869/m.161640 type:complete len:713 (-) Transcript_73869:38-2176(-)
MRAREGHNAAPHRWVRDRVALPSHILLEGLPTPSSEIAALYWEEHGHPGEGLQPRPFSGSQTARKPRKEVPPKYLLTSLLPYNEAQQKQQAAAALSLKSESAARPKLRADNSGNDAFEEEIVESPTSVVITTGEGEVRVPPRFWLVVESNIDKNEELPESKTDALPGMLPEIRNKHQDDATAIKKDRPISRLLSLCAGGGHILEDSARSIRRVSPSRLRTTGAERNFQRASTSTSLVALRHAARALEIVQEREGVNINEQSPDDQLQAWDGAPRHTPSKQPSVFDRMQRMQTVVKGFAEVAQKRAECPPSATHEDASSAIRYEMPNMERESRTRTTLQNGVLALEDFLDFVTRHYGNPVRAWFELDVNQNMRLAEKQFVRRVQDIGFRGNIPALWRYLDSGHSGTASLVGLDVRSAIILASFKQFISQSFEDSIKTFFKAVDDNRSGKIWKVDFKERLPTLGYTGPVGRCFDLLDRNKLGYLKLIDLNFLTTWAPQEYLYIEANPSALRNFKQALIALYGDPLFRVWRRVLDRSGLMKITWEEFKQACLRILSSPANASHSIPRTEVEMAAVWRAMDVDCSGTASLREFDPAAYQALGSFRLWTHKHYGSVVQLFRELDDNGNGRVSLTELGAIKRGPNGFTGSVPLVFSLLDVNGERLLTEYDVKFLDNWDVWWEEWETVLRKRRRWLRGGGGRRHMPQQTSEAMSVYPSD